MAFVNTINNNSSTDFSNDFFAENMHPAFVICKSPEKLNAIISALNTSDTVHFISKGDWSISDLVIALLNKYNPSELYFSTYSFREHQARQLFLAQDKGLITSINMLVDYRINVRTPEVMQLAANTFNRISYLRIHAKVCVIDSPIGKISIAGSANWTSNPRLEQGVISTNPELANFHINWFNDIFNDKNIFI